MLVAHCYYVIRSSEDGGLLRHIGHAGDEAIAAFKTCRWVKWEARPPQAAGAR